jgi:hypothetical protein
MATSIDAATNYVEAITPSDTVDLPQFSTYQRLTLGIYVGGTGDVSVVMQNGNVLPVSFKGLPVGTFLRVAARRINAGGTSATQLLACYVI